MRSQANEFVFQILCVTKEYNVRIGLFMQLRWPVCPGMSSSHVVAWDGNARRGAVTTVANHMRLHLCFQMQGSPPVPMSGSVFVSLGLV